MTPAKVRLLQLLKERSLIFGEVTLASGQKSKYYVDGKMILMGSESATLIGELICDAIKDLDVVAVGGPGLGAIPMATAAVIHAHGMGKALEGFSVRKEVKGHGTQKLVEGKLKPGDRVAIVEDVMTTGGSVLQAIEALQQFGARIEAVVCIVDRLQSARERIEGMGLRFLPMFSIHDLGV